MAHVFDFDQTIYQGDSTVDFYFYCLRKHPKLLCCLPKQGAAAIKYLLRKVDKTQFKECFYQFLQKVDAPALLSGFWESHFQNIKPWYIHHQQDSDIIISASPEFLLRPACKRLGVNRLIAFRVNSRTGVYTGENCHGEEKVRRLRETYGSVEISEFYSDSQSDLPLARLAESAYLVKGNKISKWKINA